MPNTLQARASHPHAPDKCASECPTAWEGLRAVLPVEVWSRSEDLDGKDDPCTADGDAALEATARVLARQRHGHVILTGDHGVGKTTLVRHLAQAAIRGQFPHLRGRRFVRLDVANVGPEDSRACLEAIVRGGMDDPEAILCLDGLASLWPRPHGGSNKPLLRSLFGRPGLRILGVMTDWEYAEHIGSDAQLLSLVSRVRLDEPREDDARTIAQHVAGNYGRHFGVQVSPEIAARAVTLSSTFLLNQRHPAKGLSILWRACENVALNSADLEHGTPAIRDGDVLQAVAELTDLPLDIINGEGADNDFEAALRQAVVGQEEAIEEVAAELRLITAGLTEPEKPASVLLFAGTTGVGKTELAKRMAELYSTSRRVNVYSMGNFTESHSVSGLVGVPPGYVGHEQGGRLINELNADPYAVFLLDEAEKCHPNVWKPFLHLFDEGWIVDQRGVKARADHAIFILTTNAGDRQITQLSKAGKPVEEIEEQVRKALSRIRHERSSQVVFPPQFLARIKRIVIFRPLDAAAMQGIADRVAARLRRHWNARQEKDLLIDPSVIRAVAQRAYEANQNAEGQEGGRIVRKLFADLVERRIQKASLTDREAYRSSRQILVNLPDGTNSLDEMAIVF